MEEVKLALALASLTSFYSVTLALALVSLSLLALCLAQMNWYSIQYILFKSPRHARWETVAGVRETISHFHSACHHCKPSHSSVKVHVSCIYLQKTTQSASASIPRYSSLSERKQRQSVYANICKRNLKAATLIDIGRDLIVVGSYCSVADLRQHKLITRRKNHSADRFQWPKTNHTSSSLINHDTRIRYPFCDQRTSLCLHANQWQHDQTCNSKTRPLTSLAAGWITVVAMIEYYARTSRSVFCQKY